MCIAAAIDLITPGVMLLPTVRLTYKPLKKDFTIYTYYLYIAFIVALLV